jgi:hypothetical protein
VGLKSSLQLAPACDPPLFYRSIQLRICFSSVMAAFSMQKDQRLLPALRHLGDSETIYQNTDITGSTLNAFRLFISSVSAPLSFAPYSLTNQNPNVLSSERYMSSYTLYFPAHPRRIPSFVHNVYYEEIIGSFVIPIQVLIPSPSLVPCLKYINSEYRPFARVVCWW